MPSPIIISETAPETRESTAADSELCPLSFAQERLWFLDQLGPGSPAYNIVQAWRIEGVLNAAAFQGAANELARRHENLRTNFHAAQGKPVVVISTYAPLSIPVLDLSSELDPVAAARRLISEEVQHPFNLTNESLFRVRLLRLGDAEHVAIFNLHHIIADGASFEILRQEMASVYSALCSGQSIDLPELPIQYLDYAQWQREQFRDEPPAGAVEFWKRELAGAPPTLELPCDHSPAAAAGYGGDAIGFELTPELTEAIRDVARHEGATSFVVLLAAFQSFLHRLTGQDDIVVGSVISGRNRTETEGLIGLFVDTLPLRTRFDGDPRFTDLLAKVRETVLNSFGHADLPFEKIVEAVHPDRQLDQNPLVQVVMTLRGAYADAWLMGALRCSLIEVETRCAKFDWTFLLEETTSGIKGRLEYKTDLFKPDTIHRFLQHFKTFLQGIAGAPQTRISRLPLMSDGERLRELTRGAAVEHYERDASIHSLFERQAAQTPDAIALVFGNERTTYHQLNERANAMAQRLIASGVVPGSCVAVALDRSVEMIVALLAILKAGAAYVPLDRSYPRERLEFMLRDASVSAVIVPSQSRSSLRGNTAEDRREEAHFSACLSAIPVVQMGRDDISRSPETLSNPAFTVSASAPAYVIYTSGSTGTPKGVLIPHRGVVRLVRHPNYVNISPRDIFLQLAPVTFDASTFEIWGALLNGASLVIAPPGILSLEELGRIIEAHRVSILWLTAGLFHQMIEHQTDRLVSVRQLLAGGDVLSVPHVLQALKKLPDCQIINGYGPTENTTFTCCYRVPRQWPGGRSVPIGQPISNTHVLILDANLSPVPAGVAGELCIAGDGLAPGYLNRSELTAEKFVPNPFPGPVPGDRLYRTGDQARWLPDGSVEFLGRKDLQVKVRGFRVELGEIEAALARHPGVRECAAIARDRAGSRELAAYVVARSKTDCSESTLKTFLQSVLPAHMVPTHFVLLDQLPLTPNGKVDRRALPDHEPAVPTLIFPAPRSETERTLHEIWRVVLGRNSFGIDDNFFQLGGHSLLATQVISRVAKAFQVELPVRALFEAPTVAALAARIQQQPRTTMDLAPAIGRRTSRAEARQLLDRIDQLSENEVESLLASRTAKKSYHEPA